MNPQHPEGLFLGRGWSFPPTFDRFSRGVAMAVADEDIRQAIRVIFEISPGERAMQPKFGCNLRRYAFRPVDSSVTTMIETTIRSALLNYEPRINVNRVTVETGESLAAGEILVTLDYTVRGVNRRHNLVVPYSLNEATALV